MINMAYNIVTDHKKQQAQAIENLFDVASGKLKRKEEINKKRIALGLEPLGDDTNE